MTIIMITFLFYRVSAGLESVITDLPKNLITYNVPAETTEIQALFTESQKTLKRITFLGKKLKKIPRGMCAGCRKLEDINLQICQNLKFIAENAFENCTSLKLITIPSNVRTISAHAFYGCEILEQVIFPKDSKVSYILTDSFSFSGLTSIFIPSSIKSILEGAFRYTVKLKSIEIESSSKYYTSNGVLHSTNETFIHTHNHGDPSETFVIDKSVRGVWGYAFAGSNNIKELIFEKGTYEFFRGSFSYMENLRIANMSAICIWFVGGEMFLDCSNLLSVIFPRNMQNFPTSLIKGCTNIERIVFPRTVMRLHPSFFEDCYHIRYLKLTKSVYYLVQPVIPKDAIIEIYPEILMRVVDVTNLICKSPFHCHRPN